MEFSPADTELKQPVRAVFKQCTDAWKLHKNLIHLRMSGGASINEDVFYKGWVIPLLLSHFCPALSFVESGLVKHING